MKRNIDVAIIGSGPSGAYAAYQLAKHGKTVLIIEKETLPRYKVCGGGLVYRGKELLDFDIEEIIEASFEKVDIYVENKDVHFQPERDKPIITMVMRDSFDFHIVNKAIELGAELLQNAEVNKIDDGIIKFANSEVEVHAKFIIIADGALSPVSKIAGFKDDRELIPAVEYEIEVPEEDFERLSKSVRFDIDAIPSGYGWSFPKKNHLSIGVGVFKTKSKLKLRDYAEKYIEKLGITTRLNQSVHGFVISITPRKEIVKGNCFVIGDAAGFADPIVGEGISNALLSGKLVADAIAEANMDREQAEILFKKKLNEKLFPELAIGIRLARFFYENRTLRNLFVERFGGLAAERLTEVFLGRATYPSDVRKKLQEKLKQTIPWFN